ncbi:hypothetical protein POM88_026416 [Heracleum sosnowskyi]|uniref:Uncharacterized protein n=1 Tax=Heracleum sosnowskyi TaxID=360622 RepID=A0AAD8I5T6_9APIA|nr:hypothetical protein POM88_026416 [Heracleum sosnowskyi]
MESLKVIRGIKLWTSILPKSICSPRSLATATTPLQKERSKDEDIQKTCKEWRRAAKVVKGSAETVTTVTKQVDEKATQATEAVLNAKEAVVKTAKEIGESSEKIRDKFTGK